MEETSKINFSPDQSGEERYNKIDFLPDQLGEAIYSWLSYTSCTSESNVLAESSVRYPLAEFIERRLQRPVTLELTHPCLPQPKTGHKRCIDFVFSKIERKKIVYTKKNEIGKERVYIELKYVSENNKNLNEKQRVFNDLVRLALVSSKTNECYFILCGSNDDFRKYVNVSPAAEEDSNRHNLPTYTEEKTSKKRISSDYTKWLYFKKTKEDKIKEISTDSDSVKSIKGTKNYKDGFDDEYNFYTDKNNNKKRYDDSVDIPETICTKLEYIKDRSGVNEKMMVAIWKVWAKSEEKNDDQKTS